MDCTVTHLTYGKTGYFSRLITDYIERNNALESFYEYAVTEDGLIDAIKAREQFPTNRKALTDYLQQQYQDAGSEKTRQHINWLKQENTFTICTAHQPVIFTGTLYFIYKIMHVIKLADHLNKKMPQNKFVPVFYMGCEDADLKELGTIYLNGEKITWDTKQKGAVGRMKPAGLDKIINRIEGELSIHPFGNELVSLLRVCYLESHDIQTGTFKLLDHLFKDYGLIVFIPDNGDLKKLMKRVFEDDLFSQTPSTVVEATVEGLQEYKVQAKPRDINLFYLHDNIRNRIVRKGNNWMVVDSEIYFNEAQLKKELADHPERFSPNVILRGLFQETVLPNIAFVGGGGEIAYWLELKMLFQHYQIPFPVLILRNSFLIIENKWKEKMKQLGIGETDLFKSEQDIINHVVKKESGAQLTLAEEISHANGYYDHLRTVASKVDRSLEQHVSALQAKAVKPIELLEKKLLKAEKKKFEAQQRHISSIKSHLFPNGNLQERIENFIPYYARYGRDFFELIYNHSLLLEQHFTVLTLNVGSEIQEK